MGALRKYGALMIVIFAILFIASLPSAFLRFIPSPAGSGLDVIFLVFVLMVIFIFWKG